MMKRKSLLKGAMVLMFVSILLTSCDPSKKWAMEEAQYIEEFLSTRGDTVFEKKPSGLYYLELEPGTGVMPEKDDTVSIRFRGFFLTYEPFDSNLMLAEPLSFIVGSGYIIEGLDEGVRYMKEGGKSKMLTPSSLAYGSGGVWGMIAGYTPLIWEIRLVDVRPAKKK